MTRARRRPRPTDHASGADGAALWRLARATVFERRADPPAVALPSRPTLGSRWHRVDGVRVHAREAAEPAAGAPPVLLIHGVVVSNRYLLPLAAELAPRHPVVVPDLTGFGLSARRRESPSLASLADDALACARAAGHERVSLVANSFGCQIAVAAALRHPERVERLALLAPTIDPAARSLPAQVLRWLRSAPVEHPSIFPILTRDLVDLRPSAILRALRLMLDDAIEDKLPKIECPALVVSGGRDRIAPPGWTHRAAALLPNGAAVVLPGLGHMAHYSAARAVARVLRAFLAPD